jgi:peptidyl-prolyl cis-trans isomerase B (cyclophilin B)
MPNEVAVVETTAGSMVLELWPDVAPGTVENFKKLANDGFYDGTCFHRIVKGFMIQGGDPLTKDASREPVWGTGGPGYQIKAEFSDRPHGRGVLSMARSRDPNSAGSQFFICLADARFLDGQYTAFGQLTQGDDVLEAIGGTPVSEAPGGEKSRPKVRVGVNSIRVGAAAPADA